MISGLTQAWFSVRSLLFVVVVIDLIGFGIVIPLLPFITPALGGDTTDIALIFVLYSLFGGLSAPVWGRISDRIGRKPVLVICLLGGAVAYAVIGAAESLTWIYGGRILAGVMAGNLPVATALMADLSPPTQRAKSMGLIGTAFGLGLILGPLIGGVMAGENSDMTTPFWFAAVLSLAAAGMALLLLPSGAPRGKPEHTDGVKPLESLWQLLRRRKLLSLVLCYVFHTWAISASIYLFPLWVNARLAWGPHEVGIFYGAVGVIMILIQGVFLGWLSQRFGVLPLLRRGALLFGTSLLLAAWVDGAWIMTIVMLFAYGGATVCLPMLNTLSTSVVGAEQRGQMMGATTASGAVGRVIGPLVTGALLTYSGYAWAWLGLALAVVVVLAWTILAGPAVETEALSSTVVE